MQSRRWLSTRLPSRATAWQLRLARCTMCGNSSSSNNNSNDSTTTATASASMGRGNYFAFFGLPVQPDVDVRELQRRYHDLQRRVHPDQENVHAAAAATAAATATATATAATHTTADDAAPAAADVSSYANGAYETLRDAFERCSYLSRLARARAAQPQRSLTAAEEEQLCVVDDERELHGRTRVSDAAPSDAFLAEVIAMNELVFCGDRDDADVRARLAVLHADVRERDADYYARAQSAWRDGDMDAFHALVVEWRFIRNVLRHLQERL